MGQRVGSIRSGSAGRGVFRSALGFAQVAGVAGLSLFALASPEASAGHGYGRHWHGGSVGVVIGGPLVWPFYGVGAWPYWRGGPYVAVLPAVVEAGLPVYVERGSVATDDAGAGAGGGSGGEGWWHYCSKPEGYYPYVKKCPRGWEKVAPSPSD